MALSQLLKYFAEDGDLYPPDDNATGTSSGPASISSDHDLLVDPSDRVTCSNPLTTSQLVKVKDLMVEAMEDQPRENTKEKPSKFFFFFFNEIDARRRYAGKVHPLKAWIGPSIVKRRREISMVSGLKQLKAIRRGEDCEGSEFPLWRS